MATINTTIGPNKKAKNPAGSQTLNSRPQSSNLFNFEIAIAAQKRLVANAHPSIAAAAARAGDGPLRLRARATTAAVKKVEAPTTAESIA